MSESWFIYAPVTKAAAERAVAAAYQALGKIVGEDVAEDLEKGDELEPAMLGVWPDLSASSSVPSVDEERDSLNEVGKTEVRFEEAALERLATCKSAVRIDRGIPEFDPALVTALRILVGKLGACVFTENPGSELETSEALLKRIAALPDLATAQKSEDEEVGAAAKKRGAAAAKSEDDDEGEEEDDEEDEDEEEVEEPLQETSDARPDAIRSTLAEIAQNPRARRKAGELLSGASDEIGAYAERLARSGPEPDAVVARALNKPEADVKAARLELAKLLRRLDGPR
ncbi:MAG: hypothetical protein JWP97_2353 [Labilithrix sp.]|nr:hypothetical protein [Labilithrix sp.]